MSDLDNLDTKDILIIVLVLVLVGVVTYLFLRKNKNCKPCKPCPVANNPLNWRPEQIQELVSFMKLYSPNLNLTTKQVECLVTEIISQITYTAFSNSKDKSILAPIVNNTQCNLNY